MTVLFRERNYLFLRDENEDIFFMVYPIIGEMTPFYRFKLKDLFFFFSTLLEICKNLENIKNILY